MQQREHRALTEAAAFAASSMRVCLADLEDLASDALRFVDLPPVAHRLDILSNIEREIAAVRNHLADLVQMFEITVKGLGRTDLLDIVRRVRRLPHLSFSAPADGCCGVAIEDVDQFVREAHTLWCDLHGLTWEV